MQILLFILKIILIILLVLIGMIALALAIILFVPIHYDVSGEIKDEYQIEVKGIVRYLLSIFKAEFSYRDGQMKADIYLFGRRKALLSEEEALNEEDIFEKEGFAQEEIANQEVEEDEISVFPQESVSENEKSDVLCEEQLPDKEILQSAEEDLNAKKILKQKAKTQDTSKKIKSDKAKIDFELIKRELTDEHNHNVLKKIFAELKYLLAHFGFRKIKTNLYFGAGDPALTGQILGILAMFPVLYRYEFGIIPDFEAEEAYIKGTFTVAGRIRLVHILIVVCRFILDKEVRFVIKKFMDMRNQ